MDQVPSDTPAQPVQQFAGTGQNVQMTSEMPAESVETNGVASVASPADVYANSVDVSIEPNHELELLEIKYDGQEVYKE